MSADLKVVLRQTGLHGQFFKCKGCGVRLGSVFRLTYLILILPQKSGVQVTSIGSDQSEVVLPLLLLPLLLLLPVLEELRDPAPRRIECDSGPVLRARLGNDRARCHIVLIRNLNVVVICIQLLFQRVQLRLVENLPPVAADGRFLRAAGIESGAGGVDIYCCCSFAFQRSNAGPELRSVFVIILGVSDIGRLIDWNQWNSLPRKIRLKTSNNHFRSRPTIRKVCRKAPSWM